MLAIDYIIVSCYNMGYHEQSHYARSSHIGNCKPRIEFLLAIIAPATKECSLVSAEIEFGMIRSFKFIADEASPKYLHRL